MNHSKLSKTKTQHLSLLIHKLYHQFKIMVLFLTISLSIILIVLANYIFQRFRYKLPPGPKPWPVIGNIYDVKPVRCRCFHEWAQTYGPIISFKLASELNIVVSNGELAKQVLKEHDHDLANRHRSAAGRVTRNDVGFIWADYGPFYVKVRKASTMAFFNPKILGAQRPIREDEVNAMIESIFNDCANPVNKGKPLTIRKYLEILSLNNISRLTFGKRLINSKGEVDSTGMELKSIINGLMVKSKRTNLVAEYLPWLHWLLSSPNKETVDDKFFNDRKDQFIRDMIKEQAEGNSENTDGSTTKQYLLEALLALMDAYHLSEDIIFSLCWDIIIAGSDTIAISTEWALAELIRNPRVQKKAQEELDNIIGSERIMTEADFSNLPYLQAIAKESLRLHPPTPLMLPHKAKTHVKIGGYDVPKGSVVHVNVWALGRDPNVWGDVNEFRPERFMEEDIDIKGHDFRVLPFGAGRRKCPAAQVGITMITSTLGHLLHHFDWNPPNGVRREDIDISEKPGVAAYMKTPLEAIPVPRLPASLYKNSSVDM